MSSEPHDERLCRNCRHFNSNANKLARLGTCRAHPPQLIDPSGGYQFDWCFPKVDEMDRCGEWAPQRSPNP
jgi:hypothetical protein